MIDTSLFVGPCPFRDVPSSAEALNLLRTRAELDRAIGTGFRSMLYFDPMDGLDRDLEEYEELSEWLSFWAAVNPEFPKLEEQADRVAKDKRIVGLRLFPGLHRYRLDSERVKRAVDLAVERGLPVNLSARVFDSRVAPRMVFQEEVDRADLFTFLERSREGTVILSMFFINELKGMKIDWNALPNVYLDLGCGKPTAASFDELPEWFPVERVLFGTGAPYYYWGGSRLALEGARLKDEDKKAILGANAREVFSWD
ncbi:MAG: amidohydrolase family protein [bacterium]|nr:amidohydrolase family protein [bacterium]